MLFSNGFTNAQETTYSAYEERMAQYVNNQLAYSWKYDSVEIVKIAIDSCKRFLEKYPNTFIKSGVLSYMLRMTSELTTDPKKILPLVDSILVYDNIATTQYGIAELLIEKNIDPIYGRKLLSSSSPQLTYSYHRFKANLLFARLEVSQGNSGIAKWYYEQAIKEDSTRAEGWQEYATFLKYSEQPTEYHNVMKKIQSLDRLNQLKYESSTNGSQNLNKSILKYHFNDIEGHSIDFQNYLGAPVLIQNFNFWCPVQKEQIKTLENIAAQYPNVKIVLMNVSESPKELKHQFLNKSKYKFYTKHKIVFADSVLWSEILGHTAHSLFVIDKFGNIKSDYSGYNKTLESKLKSDLQKLSK